MKKKILCGMLAAMMVSGALASCSGGDTSSTASNDSGSTSTSESASTEEGGESAPAASGTTASGVNIGSYTPSDETYTVKFLYLLAQEGDHLDEIEAQASAVTMDELNIGVEFIPVTYGTIDTP